MWMGFVFDPYCCVNSLQEFFLANSDRGGDHNSQNNGANSSQDDIAVSQEVKIQNSQC